MSPSVQEDVVSPEHILVLHVDVDNTIVDAWDSEVLAKAYWGRWPWASSWTLQGFLAPAQPADHVARLAATRLWELVEGEVPGMPSLEPPQSGLVSFFDACLGLGRTLKKDERRRWAEETRQLCKAFVAERAGALKHLEHIPEALRGRKYIAPSFLRLVEHLEDNNRQFRIIFRSFGNNLAATVREWNLFCDGRHPLATRPAPPERALRRVALPEGTGRWLRDANGPLLALAGTQRGQYCHDEGCAPCEVAGEGKDTEVTLLQLHGVQDASSQARERTCWQAMIGALGLPTAPAYNTPDPGVQGSHQLTLCLRECSEWWRSEGRKRHAGKLFMLDPAVLEARIDTFMLPNPSAEEMDLGVDLGERCAYGHQILGIRAGALKAWNEQRQNSSSRVRVGDWLAEVDGPSCEAAEASTQGKSQVRPGGSTMKIRRGLPGRLHHIFFDDFACDEQACSIDAKNAKTGESLSMPELQDCFLVAVKPLEVLQPNYFIDALARCEAAVQDLLSKPKSGPASEWVRKTLTDSCQTTAPVVGHGLLPLSVSEGPWRRVPMSKAAVKRPLLGGSLHALRSHTDDDDDEEPS